MFKLGSMSGFLLAMGLFGSLLAANPPPVRERPPAPRPGPCPLPTLPALPSLTDTSFYEVRDVPHGKVEQVTDANFAGRAKRMHVYLPPGYGRDETSEKRPSMRSEPRFSWKI